MSATYLLACVLTGISHPLTVVRGLFMSPFLLIAKTVVADKLFKFENYLKDLI